MKKPTKPKRPHKPSEPSEPEKEYTVTLEKDIYIQDGKKLVDSIPKEINIKDVFVRRQCWDCGGGELYYYETTTHPNVRYEVEMATYKKRLKTYKNKMKVHEEKLKEWEPLNETWKKENEKYKKHLLKEKIAKLNKQYKSL